MSVFLSGGFLIYPQHTCQRTQKKISSIKPEQSGTPKHGELSPQRDCHPQVTMLNITLGLDIERQMKARDRGSQRANGQVLENEKIGTEGKFSNSKIKRVVTIQQTKPKQDSFTTSNQINVLFSERNTY